MLQPGIFRFVFPVSFFLLTERPLLQIYGILDGIPFTVVLKWISLCTVCSESQRSKKILLPLNPIVREHEHRFWYRVQIDAVDYRYVPSLEDETKPRGISYKWLLHFKCHFTKVFLFSSFPFCSLQC